MTLNTLLTSANILKTLQRQSLGHATRHFLEKSDEVFNFEKFLIYVLAKLKPYMCLLFSLYFLIGNLNQNVYNGEFFNVNNEFYMTNIRN